jgi:hypothetical protein
MPADSLLDMTRRVAARNVHKITDIGNMPYQLVRPILLKVESPEKLVSPGCFFLPRIAGLLHPATLAACILIVASTNSNSTHHN